MPRHVDDVYCRHVQGGEIFVMASGGTSCSNGDKASVSFELDCKPGVDGEPQFLEVKDACDYTFTWATKYACMLIFLLLLERRSSVVDIFI